MTALLLLALLGDASAASKKELQAQNLELSLEAARLQASLAEVQAQLGDLQRSLEAARVGDEAQAALDGARAAKLDGLLAELDALSKALEAPPKKGVKPDPRVVAAREDLLRISAGVAALRADYTVNTAMDEVSAEELSQRLQQAMKEGDQLGARAIADELRARFPDSKAAARSQRALGELGVLGISPGEPGVLQWFSEPWRLADHRVNVVVFWEVWCPHCKRSLPALELQWRRWRDQGVGVVALTRLTKSATEEGVREFLAAEHISYPIGQEDGEYAKLFSVSGIPAAAVIRDGVVVWRGHPNMLTDEIVLGVAP